MARVYMKPKDERAFLTELRDEGVYIDAAKQPFDRIFDLYDRVLLCYWSAGMEQAVEIPCHVVGRRLAHNERRPRGIKVQPLTTEKALLLALLTEA